LRPPHPSHRISRGNIATLPGPSPNVPPPKIHSLSVPDPDPVPVPDNTLPTTRNWPCQMTLPKFGPGHGHGNDPSRDWCLGSRVGSPKYLYTQANPK
jgi:hypothetical protein